MKARKRGSPKKAAPKKKVYPAKKAVKKRTTRKKKEDCFITTACVNYFGLPDNCEQLEILRNFRDTVLTTTNEGRLIVGQYYKIAPEIVTRIEKSKGQTVIYNDVFRQVELTCKAINEQDYAKATEIYKAVVEGLIKRFNLN